MGFDEGVASTARSILATFDEVVGRLTGRLIGLSDEEYFWEPVAGCWSLRQREADGRWLLDGDGGGGPAPDPVPVTTIAWRIGHLGGTVAGFARRRFGGRDLTSSMLDFPATAVAVEAFLAEHYETWRRGLAGLDAAGWSAPLGPGWGPYADADTVDLALHVLDEVVHHGAEVGVLRDLWSAGARQVSRPPL